MKEITDDICKEAIVEFVKANPGCVNCQFCGRKEDQPEFEDAAKVKENWKKHLEKRIKKISRNKPQPPEEQDLNEVRARRARLLEDATYCRAFDYGSRGGQLRAYIYSTDTKITYIEVVGK